MPGPRHGPMARKVRWAKAQSESLKQLAKVAGVLVENWQKTMNQLTGGDPSCVHSDIHGGHDPAVAITDGYGDRPEAKLELFISQGKTIRAHAANDLDQYVPVSNGSWRQWLQLASLQTACQLLVGKRRE